MFRPMRVIIFDTTNFLLAAAAASASAHYSDFPKHPDDSESEEEREKGLEYHEHIA
jgi:hypothetical protein